MFSKFEGPCRNVGAWFFYPDTQEQERENSKFCRESGCQLIKQCRDYAIDNREQGIWGGTTQVERERLRRNRRKERAKLKVVA